MPFKIEKNKKYLKAEGIYLIGLEKATRKLITITPNS